MSPIRHYGLQVAPDGYILECRHEVVDDYERVLPSLTRYFELAHQIAQRILVELVAHLIVTVEGRVVHRQIAGQRNEQVHRMTPSMVDLGTCVRQQTCRQRAFATAGRTTKQAKTVSVGEWTGYGTDADGAPAAAASPECLR
jgi:hypothetical protein